MKNLLMPFVLLFSILGFGQQEWITANKLFPSKTEILEYKKIDSTTLKLKIFYPGDFVLDEKYPAIVFFFGGGWNNRKLEQFEPHAHYFSSKGMVSVIADYRVRNTENTTPFDAVSDAKSVIRFLRKNAAVIGIDTAKIVASGGSAGGHLAAATGTLAGLNDSLDDVSVSAVPNALVLFNPVFDNGPKGYGYEKFKDRYIEISPIHNIKTGTPPAIVFLGTNDSLIPVSTAKKFKSLMDSAGCYCELKIFDGQGHGFFNFRNFENFNATLNQTEQFLIKLGYLK